MSGKRNIEPDREIENPLNRQTGYYSKGTPKARAKKKKTKFVVLLVIEVLLVLVVAVGAFLWFYFNNKYKKTQIAASEAGISFEPEDVITNPDIPEEHAEKMKTGYTTFMIYGVDARNNSDLVKDANADTDIICSINNETGEVKLVSVLRDTFLYTSEGRHDKLTDIYAAYGVQESMQTINKCFDLTINQYVSVNWTIVAKVIDAVGGIDIELSNAEAKSINNYSYEIGSIANIPVYAVEPHGDGMYHLNGVQAAGYCRIRNVGHHDISRAERQRKVISLFVDKLKGLSLLEIDDVLDVALEGVATNLSRTDILGLAMDLSSLWIGEQGLFPVDYRDQSNLNTAYVYCTTLAENVTQLHKFLYGIDNYEPTPTVYEVSDLIDEYRKQHP